MRKGQREKKSKWLNWKGKYLQGKSNTAFLHFKQGREVSRTKKPNIPPLRRNTSDPRKAGVCVLLHPGAGPQLAVQGIRSAFLTAVQSCLLHQQQIARTFWEMASRPAGTQGENLHKNCWPREAVLLQFFQTQTQKPNRYSGNRITLTPTFLTWFQGLSKVVLDACF